MTKYCTGARGFNHQTQSCCKDHDNAYAPTSALSRFVADNNLLICVAQHGMPYRAIAMFLFLRATGWTVWYWHRLKHLVGVKV